MYNYFCVHLRKYALCTLLQLLGVAFNRTRSSSIYRPGRKKKAACSLCRNWN